MKPKRIMVRPKSLVWWIIGMAWFVFAIWFGSNVLHPWIYGPVEQAEIVGTFSTTPYDEQGDPIPEAADGWIVPAGAGQFKEYPELLPAGTCCWEINPDAMYCHPTAEDGLCYNPFEISPGCSPSDPDCPFKLNPNCLGKGFCGHFLTLDDG